MNDSPFESILQQILQLAFQLSLNMSLYFWGRTRRYYVIASRRGRPCGGVGHICLSCLHGSRSLPLPPLFGPRVENQRREDDESVQNLIQMNWQTVFERS
jgi:hypothetical protein